MKQIRHWSLILMLCWPFLLPFNRSSLFPGGIRKLFKEIVAFRSSSLILAALEMVLNFFISRSLKSFSVSLHLNDLIIVTVYDALRYSSSLKFRKFTFSNNWQAERPASAAAPGCSNKKRAAIRGQAVCFCWNSRLLIKL